MRLGQNRSDRPARRWHRQVAHLDELRSAMKTREPWNTIHNFFGGYFNEDYDMDAPDEDAVIQSYLRDHNTKEIRNLIEDIGEYMGVHPDDAELQELLLRDLGCYYNTTSDGLTARQWMTHVVDLLRQEVDRRSAARD